MNLYDSLMEMVIYEDSIEEYKERRNILNEFHYSKDQLQDPEILKKILKQTKDDVKKYNDTNEKLIKISLLLSTCISVVTHFASKSFGLSLAAFSGFMLGSFAITDEILNKIYYTNTRLDKNIEEVKNKVEKLKASATKIKNKEESQNIINNCDKVLKTIDNYYKKRYDGEKSKLDNYLNKPYFETDMAGEFRSILKYFRDEKGVSAAQFKNALCTNFKYLDYENAWDYMYGRDSEEDKENFPALYKKYLSLADKNKKVYIYTNNDDNFDFVSPITKKLYTITTNDSIEQIGDLYKWYLDD